MGWDRVHTPYVIYNNRRIGRNDYNNNNSGNMDR